MFRTGRAVLMFPRSIRLGLSSQQSIFTHAGLKLDVAETRLNKKKLLVADHDKIRTRLAESVQQDKLDDLISEDVWTMMAVSKTSEEMQVVVRMLEACLALDQRVLDLTPSLQDRLLAFFQTARLKGQPDLAMQVWNDPKFQDSGILKMEFTLARLYFDLLFESGLYDQIVLEYENDPEFVLRHWDLATLVLLAHYKIGTKGALQKALNMLNDSKVKTWSRGPSSVALLAYNLQDYRAAYDVIERYGQGRTQTLFDSSLKTMLLVDIGNLQEAINNFKLNYFQKDPNFPNRSRRVAYVCIEKLVKATLKSDNGELKKKLMDMINVLDDSCLIINQTLDDLILAPIERRKPTRPRNEQNRVETREVN